MRHTKPIFSLAAIVVVVSLGRQASAGEVLPLNEKVIQYCKDNMDKEVGGGECAELAGHALKAAGARTHTGPDSPRERDYVWGKLVYKIEAAADGLKESGTLADVRPGDIMQFRDVKFGDKGGFGHHTAIVSEVLNKDLGKIEVYQQNAGGNRFVTKRVIHKLQDMKEGYILIYRPVPER